MTGSAMRQTADETSLVSGQMGEEDTFLSPELFSLHPFTVGGEDLLEAGGPQAPAAPPLPAPSATSSGRGSAAAAAAAQQGVHSHRGVPTLNGLSKGNSRGPSRRPSAARVSPLPAQTGPWTGHFSYMPRESRISASGLDLRVTQSNVSDAQPSHLDSSQLNNSSKPLTTRPSAGSAAALQPLGPAPGASAVQQQQLRQADSYTVLEPAGNSITCEPSPSNRLTGELTGAGLQGYHSSTGFASSQGPGVHPGLLQPRISGKQQSVVWQQGIQDGEGPQVVRRSAAGGDVLHQGDGTTGGTGPPCASTSGAGGESDARRFASSMKMSITAIPSPFDRATYSVLQYIDRDEGDPDNGAAMANRIVSPRSPSPTLAQQHGSFLGTLAARITSKSSLGVPLSSDNGTLMSQLSGVHRTGSVGPLSSGGVAPKGWDPTPLTPKSPLSPIKKAPSMRSPSPVLLSDEYKASAGGSRRWAAMPMEGQPGGHQGEGGWSAVEPMRRSAKQLWSGALKSVQTMGGVARQFRTLRDMHMPGAVPREAIKVIRVLGKGAFAIVEECVYKPPAGGKPLLVAVKRLKPELTQNEADVMSMMREVALLRKLRNNNIVEFLGYGKWEFAADPQGKTVRPSLFIVEELIDGGSLKTLVHHQQRSMSTGRLYRAADAVRWLLQVAHGLQYLHQARPQVIHRDLKLENILLKGKDISSSSAKLADFGLSALVAATSEYKRKMDLEIHDQEARPARARRNSATDLDGVWADAAKARTNALAGNMDMKLAVASGYDQLSGRTGTLMYMAPEVYKQEVYSETADVFSFAIIMYELLHRYMMISATDGSFEECKAYARRVARGFRPPIDEAIPRKVRDIMTAAWSHNPANRPSMTQIIKQLKDVQATVDLEAVDRAMVGNSGMKVLNAAVNPSPWCCAVM